MTALKRFVFLSVLLGSGLLGTAAWPISFVAAAEPFPQKKTAYEVWGREAWVAGTATPENENPKGPWILLGSSDTYEGAQKTLVTITRHGGFVNLEIRTTRVKIEGMIQPKRPIEEIKPKPPAPKAVPSPKGINGVQPPAATPLLIKPLHKVGN